MPSLRRTRSKTATTIRMMKRTLKWPTTVVMNRVQMERRSHTRMNSGTTSLSCSKMKTMMRSTSRNKKSTSTFKTSRTTKCHQRTFGMSLMFRCKRDTLKLMRMATQSKMLRFKRKILKTKKTSTKAPTLKNQ